MRRGRGWALVRLGGFGLVVAALTSGIAWAVIPSPGGLISGCYSNKNGTLRIIDADGGAVCKATEKALTWNQAGPSPPLPPPLSGTVDIDLVEKSVDVLVTHSTPATAVTVITSNVKTYDGGRVYIDFFSPSITTSIGNHVFFDVYRDTTKLGEVGFYLTPTGTEQSKSFQVPDVPPIGDHTYTIKAFVGGDAIIRGGLGGSDFFPMHLRITRV